MKEKLVNAINDALKKLNLETENINIEKPKNENNGDYSTNIAMQLAKLAHQNPMNIAENIKNIIILEEIENIDIIKPGFINFFVKKDYLIENINTILKEKDRYGSNNIGNNRKINIEFVSANPTGILHIGNARGGAYGDSLARILKFSGFNVTKEYYVNDAGNQINNLALSIKSRYLELNGIECEIPENGYHGKEIIEIAYKLKEKYPNTNEIDDEIFKEEGTNYLLDQIKLDLHNYGIDFDVFTSEKFIRKQYDLNQLIEKLAQNGYIYEKDGAKWFKCSEIFDDKDHVLKKEDGTFTYFLPDIAYHYDKYLRGFYKMIDIFGTDHHGYVARLKSSVKALGNDPDKLEVKLLQLVRLVENNEIVKMSKRSGKSVSLKDLTNEIGVNAARYYFSKYSLDTQMDFDLNIAKEKSNDNPVYYVSYAYARICSILNNYNEEFIVNSYESLKNIDAYKLLEKLYEFPEVIKNSAVKELPNLITNYVYELASRFHTYYDKVRIISENEQTTKENINLLKATKITIKNALNLIGVEPPERM